MGKRSRDDEKKGSKAISGDALEDGFDLDVGYSNQGGVEDSDFKSTASSSATTPEASSAAAKRARKKKRTAAPLAGTSKSERETELQLEKRVLEATAALSAEDQSKYLISKYFGRKFDKSVGDGMPLNRVLGPEAFADPGDHIVMGLNPILAALRPPWPRPKSAPRSVTVLVLSHSAIRCCELYKAIKPSLANRTTVLKLFAKHVKIEEQAARLEAEPFGLAVATPNRVLALADKGALHLDSVRLLCIDRAPNLKNQTTVDALGLEVFRLISRLSDRITSKNLQLVLV